MDAVEWAVKRQVLGGIIGDITSGVLGGGDDTATSTADGDGGITPTLPVSSATSTSTTESSAQSTSTSSSEPTSSSATSTSSSSTSSTPTSSSTSESSSSTSSSTSSSVPTSSSSPTSSSVTPPPVTTITATDPGGSSVTTVITASSSADPSSSSGASDGDASTVSGAKAFLDNKVLSGVVFGIAGLIALIGLIFLATWYMRRTRKKDLLDEAVNFAPQSHGYGGDDMTRGLTQTSNRNSTSSGSLHGGYRPDAPPVPTYQQQQPYYGATGGAEAYPTYAAPSQIANAMNTYENPSMVDVGGAGVTRKYSNVSRVPVPNTHDMYGGYR